MQNNAGAKQYITTRGGHATTEQQASEILCCKIFIIIIQHVFLVKIIVCK